MSHTGLFKHFKELLEIFTMFIFPNVSKTYFYFMCVYVYLYAMCMPCGSENQKRASDFLELELYMCLSYFPVFVINVITKSNLGRKRFILSYSL